MQIIPHWNGIRKGDKVVLTRNIYLRQGRGSQFQTIHYEEPGYKVRSAGDIGTFSAKTDTGILVYFDNGVGAVLALVLDEFAVDKHTLKR